MAATKLPWRLGNAVVLPATVIVAEADRLEHCLSTAEVRTASPSRSGKKIQVRVVWKEPDGSNGLGYFSIYPTIVQQAVMNVTATSATQDFLHEIFRLNDWAFKKGGWKDRGFWLKALEDELDTRPAFTSSGAVALQKDATTKLRAVVTNGKHHGSRAAHLKKKARAHLTGALDHALQSGLHDDEIREMLKLAMVKHTMDS